MEHRSPREDADVDLDIAINPDTVDSFGPVRTDRSLYSTRSSCSSGGVDAPVMGEAEVVEAELEPAHRSRHDRRKPMRRGFEVWLHIYDIDPVTSRLNAWGLRDWSLGAFHCGVEVLRDEWFFHWGTTDSSGVSCIEPRRHEAHVYRESMSLGESPLLEKEIRAAIIRAMDEWTENSYHPITRNCIHFAEALIGTLRVPQPFPEWVHGAAAAAGKNPMLFPVADYGWSWIKWYCSPSDGDRTEDVVGTTPSL